MSIMSWPFSQWMDNVALAALSSRETVYASYDIARMAIERGVPGDFVECGVFGGAQCAAMARAIYDEACKDEWSDQFSSEPLRPYSRRVHLFDAERVRLPCGCAGVWVGYGTACVGPNIASAAAK